ncbi:MAG: hypothetical protein ABFE07_19705 [Armatimonadia bacterium]
MRYRWVVFGLYVLAFACLAAAETFEGQVIDETGSPLAGCAVIALNKPSIYGQERRDSVTAGDGRFSFTLEHLPRELPTIIACAPDAPLVWATASADHPTVLRITGKAVTISGIVTDLAGNAVPGAEVRLATLARQHEHHWSQYRERISCAEDSPIVSKTDAEGHFVLGSLPTGAAVGIDYKAPGYGRGHRYEIPAGMTDLHVYLRPPIVASGHVRLDGQPVPQVKVQDVYSSTSAVSAADGSFSLDDLAPGPLALMVREAPGGLIGWFAWPLLVKPGDHCDEIVIELARAAVVEGRYLDLANREPVPDMHVWGRCPRYPYTGFENGTYSGKDGRYRLALMPGEIDVYAPHEVSMGWVENMDHHFRLQPGEVKSIDIMMRKHPVVRGQVLTPQGQPAPGVEVGAITGIDYGVAPAEFASIRTDDQGRFELPVLTSSRAATREILARDVAHDLAALARPLDVAGSVTINLLPAASLAIRVVDPYGQPVPNLPVQVSFGEPSPVKLALRAGVSDAEGKLRIGPLPPKTTVRVDLGAYLNGFFVNNKDWDDQVLVLNPGEEREAGPLIVDLRGRTVHGWVGDANQKPLPGALVFAEQALCPAHTKADGRFELSGLPLTGKVRLIAAHPTQPLLAGAVVDPEWGFEPGLVPAVLATIKGRAVTADGMPVVEGLAMYQQEYPSPPLKSMERFMRLREVGQPMYCYADENGNWRIDGVVGDLPYQVRVCDRSQKLKAVTLGVAPKPGETIDLGDIKLEQQ